MTDCTCKAWGSVLGAPPCPIHSGGPGSVTWVNSWAYSPRRRVLKHLGKWVVLNHPAGNCAFLTWDEAIRYASIRYVVRNDGVLLIAAGGGA
ncbi:hypothetical protein SEA_EJIMIX_3 [Mycobacterium phage Ejimix]|uniref:hypothetical protein n=1 Tax=Mycobacterium phage Redno2 TaxID=1340709 RepID=UPI000387A8CB|nr:hypothetical protein N860_gp002 [Mycobacterium phage Redno2]AGS82301.1 hypothetical protein PBI_REDNO2_2 [Mycobacterium phage Redno2]AWH13815.1 hypothetical protein SEA_HALLEY_2 [Mycobacterium phage Halley]AXQ52007.1 hypothetical protein SEA_EJIMIX_3 [Mycobacterium phage Ejimix]QZD97875.1 hypothetical protein SEA_BEEM_2 [Mycobacterium phage Beem]